MSCTVKVITDNDRIVVYETNCGEVVFDGTKISARQLFNILEATNGMCETVEFIQMSTEQMNDWEEQL